MDISKTSCLPLSSLLVFYYYPGCFQNVFFLYVMNDFETLLETTSFVDHDFFKMFLRRLLHVRNVLNLPQKRLVWLWLPHRNISMPFCKDSKRFQNKIIRIFCFLCFKNGLMFLKNLFPFPSLVDVSCNFDSRFAYKKLLVELKISGKIRKLSESSFPHGFTHLKINSLKTAIYTVTVPAIIKQSEKELHYGFLMIRSNKPIQKVVKILLFSI